MSSGFEEFVRIPESDPNVGDLLDDEESGGGWTEPQQLLLCHYPVIFSPP